MTYSTLVKPWPALRIGTRRRMPYRRPTRMGYGVMMAVGLPVVLSALVVYYGAYVYWVALVSMAYAFILAAKGVAKLARAILRKRAVTEVGTRYYSADGTSVPRDYFGK